MTTNHINQLNNTLKHPGHVDIKILFGYADQFALQEHFLTFYLNPADDITMCVWESTNSICPLSTPACLDWKLDKIINLSVTFMDEVPPSHYTAAKVQNYLLLHKNDPVSTVHDVTEWISQQDHHLNLDCKTDISTFHVADPPISSNSTAPPATSK